MKKNLPTPRQRADEILKEMGLDRKTAYDGSSKRKPRRELDPLERDIICRVINDLLGCYMRAGDRITNPVVIRMSPFEFYMLLDVREAISPRPDGE